MMYNEDIQRCRAGLAPPKLEVSGCPHNSVYHLTCVFAVMSTAQIPMASVIVAAVRKLRLQGRTAKSIFAEKTNPYDTCTGIARVDGTLSQKERAFAAKTIVRYLTGHAIVDAVLRFK